MWLSLCSDHRERQVGCWQCDLGWEEDDEILQADHELFTTDYAVWYAKHNNGDEPTESAWETWKQLNFHQSK